MDQPQIRNSNVEFLLLVIVIRFDSSIGIQYHIEAYSRVVWTRYDETQEHIFIFHVNRR
jgi:hypothetical protein